MERKGQSDRGVRKVESGVDPSTVPVEDANAGDEGIDQVSGDPRSTEEIQDPRRKPSRQDQRGR